MGRSNPHVGLLVGICNLIAVPLAIKHCILVGHLCTKPAGESASSKRHRSLLVSASFSSTFLQHTPILYNSLGDVAGNVKVLEGFAHLGCFKKLLCMKDNVPKTYCTALTFAGTASISVAF